ncbi:MCM2/3/5 family-domain-containing protein [Ochromonadaceae sp. CCMP2298]|nr:MCM2/3/5 family-domain-containing protein [Ochromonadaceae sp. CCMP2298]
MGDAWGGSRLTNFDIDGSSARNRFREFFRNFQLENVYIYRDALIRNWNRKELFVEVDLFHLNQFDEVLFNTLQTRPNDIMSFFEAGAKDALKMSLTVENREVLNQATVADFQIILRSNQNTQSLRTLTAEHANTLIKVPGIIITSSKTRPKATVICIRCTKCQCVKRIPCKSVFGGAMLPGRCDRDGRNDGDDCGSMPYVIMGDLCEYIDQQTLKLQESPEVVPTGEMPRNIMISVDRRLVDKVTPGTRVSVIGISSLYNSGGRVKSSAANPLRNLFLRVLGIHIEMEGGGRTSTVFSPQEEEEMQRMARDPDIYEKVARSIAPQISGDYTRDIKKALALLLMGGSRKILPDGVRLRGDINVLLMGDPSTAKSQFLKFIERIAPIGVYTSGKGSSAAGLTASVIKDAKGEFFLEGGAMVLADGGVICIDEFDKMREQDRVAIHEAMEQQTISIAKAGITTVLNCRASVLAAANPIYGRYDDMKDVGDNIDLMTTILSRFDMIFIVRDVRDAERDISIAKHVMGVHINSSIQDSSANNSAEISSTTLKKFINYCRERCAPRLNDEAAALLSGQYVHIRNRIRESLLNRPGESQVVPITVRQLEALVRMSEALAKMRLSAEATVSDVEEAMRLFKISTLAASQSSPVMAGGMGGVGGIPPGDVNRAEEYLKRRMGLRESTGTKRLLEEGQGQGHSSEALKRGIMAMVMRNELQEINQGKMVRRIR